MKRLAILGTSVVLLSATFIQYAVSFEEVQIANPASVYCVQSGYKLEIRANANGSQYGVCIFPDGNECEEWSFFRNECGAGYRIIPDTNSKGKNKQEKD
jgi:putative hemolysin